MRHATILVAILAVAPIASTAQETPTAQVPLRPGERVRVTGHFCQPFYSNCVRGSPQQYVGTFMTWNADTLVTESNGDILALPLDSVTTLEVSAPRTSQAGSFAAILGVTGAVVGAVVGGASCTDERFVTPGQCAVVGGLVFGAAGALLGALAGAAGTTERWLSVPLDHRRARFGPQPDGSFGFGASVKF